MQEERQIKLEQHQGVLSQLKKRELTKRKDLGDLKTKACYKGSVARFARLDRSLKDGAGERIRTLDPRNPGARPDQLGTLNVPIKVFVRSKRLKPYQFDRIITSVPEKVNLPLASKFVNP